MRWISNTLMLPVMLTVVPLAGWVVDQTGTYVPLFLAGAIGAIVAGLGFSCFVTEPRGLDSQSKVGLI